MEYNDILNKQRAFFATNTTKDVRYRIEQLKKLKRILKENEPLMYEGISKDFGKSEYETYLSEFSLVYHEINGFIKHTKRWSERKRVATNFANFPASSYIIPEPLGTTLVIGAWNYPYQLSLIPAIAALAAGNTVILKPSELPAKTSAIMAKLINENFPAEYFHVIEGGVPETSALLEQRFDKIFFTGSTPVGKIVYQAAAKHLTPVTLELGGKSPTFVLSDANIKMTVKRMVWAKFLNAGQTCVAPDYVLVENKIKDKFLQALKNEIEKYHSGEEELHENYTLIISERHYDRLNSLIEPEKVYFGGEAMSRDKRFMGPVVLSEVSFDDKIMEDEIFGPILPVISFEDLDEVIAKVKAGEKPLSCYIYSKNKKKINKLLRELSFGGGAINDSMMHLANSNLPFGGVGFSGMGHYHGKFGFQSFSHYKSVLHKPFWYEAPVKYPPYSKIKMKLLKLLME